MKSIQDLNLAVVGHTEWVSFISVERLPEPGLISHGNNYKEEPAGGGVVAAVQMTRLTNKRVHFFTSLGKDSLGRKCVEKLTSLGIEMHVAWREIPTRKGFSFVGSNGDRAITVIGERIQIEKSDPLPWDLLKDFDGIFLTAADVETIQLCRQSKVLCATPRLKAKYLNQANIKLDALIGSNLDYEEKEETRKVLIKPKVTILTEGALGGEVKPGDRFQALRLSTKEIDSYGCGDSFAAGVTTGLAGNLELQDAIKLGARCGANCATIFGPY